MLLFRPKFSLLSYLRLLFCPRLLFSREEYYASKQTHPGQFPVNQRHFDLLFGLFGFVLNFLAFDWDIRLILTLFLVKLVVMESLVSLAMASIVCGGSIRTSVRRIPECNRFSSKEDSIFRLEMAHAYKATLRGAPAGN